MKKQYDFSKLKALKNPYAGKKKVRKLWTIRVKGDHPPNKNGPPSFHSKSHSNFAFD